MADDTVRDVRTIKLSRLHDLDQQWFTLNFRTLKADAVLVVVETEGGLRGIGEVCSYGGPNAIGSWVTWMSRTMVGRRLDDAWRVARSRGRDWAHDGAAAGIDCALWDLRGQLAGKPVAELLGATAGPTTVPAYASGGCSYDWGVDPLRVVEEVVGYQAHGFTTCKIRVGTEWAWNSVTPDDFLRVARAIRAAVGDDFRLAVDGNQRLGAAEAFEVARGLADLGFAWFEDPTPIDDIETYIALRREVPDLVISGGEVMLTAEQFRPYLEREALGMLHPDAGWSGLTEARLITEMAASYGVPCNPHGWHNGVLAVIHAHLIAAAPLPGHVEVNMQQGPLRDALLADGIPLSNGAIAISDSPGFGLHLGHDLEERFPYLDHDYQAAMER